MIYIYGVIKLRTRIMVCHCVIISHLTLKFWNCSMKLMETSWETNSQRLIDHIFCNHNDAKISGSSNAHILLRTSLIGASFVCGVLKKLIWLLCPFPNLMKGNRLPCGISSRWRCSFAMYFSLLTRQQINLPDNL